MVQTGHRLEIHALTLKDEVVDPVALVADLQAIRAISEFARSQLIGVVVPHREVHRVHRGRLLAIRLLLPSLLG